MEKIFVSFILGLFIMSVFAVGVSAVMPEKNKKVLCDVVLSKGHAQVSIPLQVAEKLPHIFMCELGSGNSSEDEYGDEELEEEPVLPPVELLVVPAL